MVAVSIRGGGGVEGAVVGISNEHKKKTAAMIKILAKRTRNQVPGLLLFLLLCRLFCRCC